MYHSENAPVAQAPIDANAPCHPVGHHTLHAVLSPTPPPIGNAAAVPDGSFTPGINLPASSPQVQSVLAMFRNVRQASPTQWAGTCPAHDDTHPSLSITVRGDRVLLFCHAGCTFSAVLSAAGLTRDDLRLPTTLEQAIASTAARLRGMSVSHWIYRDVDGIPVLAIARFATAEGKTYRPFSAVLHGWRPGAPSTPLPPYRLPELAGVDRITVVEGEKCVDILRTLGIPATTSAFGAQAPHRTDWRPLCDLDVAIIPDNDVAGEKYAQQVADAAQKVGARSIKIVRLPGLDTGGDVADFVETRKDVPTVQIAAELSGLIAAAPIPPSGLFASASTDALQAEDAHFTDLGNARRLVRDHGADLHFVYELRRWFIWDDTRWCLDRTGEIVRRAKDSVRRMYADAARVTDEKQRKALVRHALSSEAESRLRAMTTLAQSEPDIAITPDRLDCSPWLLNVKNGTIDLHTGELRPHARHDLITKRIEFSFDPRACCPRWEATLERIMGGSKELMDFLQRAVGYSLTGDTREQVLFFCYGRGANGKTTFTKTLLNLLGPYATQADPDLLIARRGERHPTGVADLRGHRLVVSTEVENGERMAEVVVKQLTGQDRVKARFMRQDFSEFEATFKIWLAANHKPQVRGTDHAIWRRILLVPFAVSIPREQQDRELATKLAAELPGILAWAVRGCLAWQHSGLQPPQEVLAATAAYREEMDTLAEFLDDACTLNAAARIRVKALYESYGRWCDRRRQCPLAKSDFRDALVDHGLAAPSKSTGGVYWWDGIALKVGTASDRTEWSGPISGSTAPSLQHEASTPDGVHSTPLKPTAAAAQQAPAPVGVPSTATETVTGTGNSEVW